MASMPVVKILLISGLGAVLATRYAGVLTEDSLKHLNKVKDQGFEISKIHIAFLQTCQNGILL